MKTFSPILVIQIAKEIAKELFIEVIDEMAKTLCTNFFDLIRLLTTEARDILQSLINDASQDLLK